MNKTAINNASSIDISKAPSHLQAKLKQAHIQYADVFAPDLTIGYNGKSGEHFVRLQFADDNRPQMSKCHIPKWSGKNDKIKQKKMDVLERQGVLVDPYKERISIEMCQLLTKVLGEEIEKQNVIVQADDGQVGGRTVEETIDNWIRVLKLCSENNLKINHQK